MAALTSADLVPHAPERRLIEGDGTDERAWREWPLIDQLESIDARDWVGRFDTIWLIAPHPDDEVLALGGTLSILSKIHADLRIVSVTDGEASHRDSSHWSRERLAQARPVELRRALDTLAIDAKISRLGLPDGQIGAHRQTLLTALAEVTGERDLILTTCRFDGHPDHEACGEVAELIGQLTGATIYEYPVWMWHWAKPLETTIPWHRARRLPIAAGVVESKQAAIAAFVSQVTPDGQHEAVLPSRVLPRYLRPFEVVFA